MSPKLFNLGKYLRTEVAIVVTLFLTICLNGKIHSQVFDWETVQDSTSIVFSVSKGLLGPEGVRYDEDLDIYFISNLNGRGRKKDANGFISKVDYQGNVISSKFMIGTDSYPLHAPKGMFIINDELFVADIEGVHVFNKRKGTHLRFIDFSRFEPGLLNDISADENGTLYVTDTLKPRVYRVKNDLSEVFIDQLSFSPNGVTRNPFNDEFVLATWRGSTSLYSFDNDATLNQFTKLDGGFFDGLEFLGNNIIVASQLDSTLRFVSRTGENDILIKVLARPADIGLDTRRYRIAVPYVAENRVDFWEIKRK